MNGNSGIVPTVDLATNNNAYPVYPVMYGNGGFGGNGMFGGDAIWLIVLLALIWNGNNGNGGFFGGNGGFDNGYAWLSNGQKEIMTNTNNDFDTLHLSDQLDTVNSGIYSLSNQLCNCCGDMQQTVSNGFANAEVAANARQIADMNQNFSNQIATLQGFNGLQKSFDSCCCENRLGLERLNATVLSENCADREALSNGIRDIIASQNNGVQRIIDQLCSDKIDAKNEKIADLQREILMKDLQASQVAQTADLRANNAVVANQLVAELRSCPIPAVAVYGNTPVFTCPNNGCGCGNNAYYGTNII